MSKEKSVKQIRLPRPMTTMPVRQVFDALGEENVRFVGGCVRNAILEEEITDIDVATKLLPQEATKRLEKNDIKVIPTGIEHGTITAVNAGTSVEITTLRKDEGTDGRRAVVAFTDDWVEDAKRRDFTMNTLLSDLEGNIFDPMGQGVKDLSARRVIFVGDPAQRIAEDRLRILRYFRFNAYYGTGIPHQPAIKACSEAAETIAHLSKERITQEIFKILSLPDPTATLKLMFGNGVMADFPAKDFDIELFSALCHFQKRFGLAALSPRLMVLGSVKHLSRYLLIPKVFQKDMKAIAAVLEMKDLKKDQGVKTAVYKQGRTATAQALMIELGQDRITPKQAKSALNVIQNWDIPDFPLTGEDLKKEGFKAGPKMGEELAKREDAWIKGGFKT